MKRIDNIADVLLHLFISIEDRFDPKYIQINNDLLLAISGYTVIPRDLLGDINSYLVLQNLILVDFEDTAFLIEFDRFIIGDQSGTGILSYYPS